MTYLIGALVLAFATVILTVWAASRAVRKAAAKRDMEIARKGIAELRELQRKPPEHEG